MKKKRSMRMDPLIHIASADEKKAAIFLKQQDQLWMTAQHHLTELQRYRLEYRQSLQDVASQAGMMGLRFRQTCSFLIALDQAIIQQRNIMQNCRVECEKARAIWLKKHERVMILEKAKDKFVEGELMQQYRLEAKQLDAFVTENYKPLTLSLSHKKRGRGEV